MKTVSFLAMLICINLSISFSQVAINSDGSPPDGSAMLEVKSIEKGFLIPQMSQSQISAIENPADGLQVYCTTDGKMYIFTAPLGQWKEVAFSAGVINPPFTCGMNITIDHVEGNVAPVTKTTTYGTVSGVPGEATKCWITSNLGSDWQATAVDDATEASAGWYWQFNRKQGYKHDGSTLTPAWTITEIVENSNWLAENDPCTIELGSNWRIPTYTEWTNVDATGDWTDWNGPWGSLLKIHAAGNLSNSTGNLISRGTIGRYWSSTQNTDTWGRYLFFLSTDCTVIHIVKAYGYSLRCLRNP